MNVRVFIDALTPAGDFVTFAPGTQTDTEDLVTGRPYGVGTLTTAIIAGAMDLEVVGEHPASYVTLEPFRIGDLIRVSDRPSTGGAGNEEWVTISDVLYADDVLSITVTPALIHPYAIENTVVSSIFETAQIVGRWDTFSKTSVAGNFDSATLGNLVAHNKGAIEESWTLTFTGATTFSVSGQSVGAVAAVGSTAADYAPVNPATGTAYFTIKALAWSGTWVTNDQVRFATHPAALPIWYRREVPAGTFSLANDYASLAIHGESA